MGNPEGMSRACNSADKSCPLNTDRLNNLKRNVESAEMKDFEEGARESTDKNGNTLQEVTKVIDKGDGESVRQTAKRVIDKEGRVLSMVTQSEYLTADGQTLGRTRQAHDFGYGNERVVSTRIVVGDGSISPTEKRSGWRLVNRTVESNCDGKETIECDKPTVMPTANGDFVKVSPDAKPAKRSENTPPDATWANDLFSQYGMN